MKKLIVELFLKDERNHATINGMLSVKNFVRGDVVSDMKAEGLL
jgi:hypothetical protein